MAQANFFSLIRTAEGRKALSNLLSFIENKGQRNKAYDAFLFLVMSSVGAKAGALWLYDSFGGHRINVVSTKGSISYPLKTLSLGEENVGQVIQSGNSILTQDYQRLCVPIKTQNAVFGAIDLVLPQNDLFSQRDKDMALSISSTLAETIVSHSDSLVLGYYDLNPEHDARYSYESGGVIETLAAIIDTRSVETGKHSKRMRYLCQLVLSEVARREPAYHLNDGRIELISNAITLHDIGKIAISDTILNKPGKLEVAEYEIVKHHTIIGEQLVSKLAGSVSNEFLQYAREVCLQHHERYDGKGYPNRLKGEKIPIWSQCAGLIDAYDALISRRSYKGAYTHEQAVEMLKNGECGAFSPLLIDCFVSVSDNIKAMVATLGGAEMNNESN